MAQIFDIDGKTINPAQHRTVSVAINPGSNVEVGTEPVTVLPANADRISAVMVNDSDTTIYLHLAATGAVGGKGIPLVANGGSYEINSTNLYIGSITAIASAAGKSLCVVEF